MIIVELSIKNYPSLYWTIKPKYVKNHQWLRCTATPFHLHPKQLKTFQNKKGQKVFKVHCFGVFFSAVKKDTENGAPGNCFGPSYFVTAIIAYRFECESWKSDLMIFTMWTFPNFAFYYLALFLLFKRQVIERSKSKLNFTAL